MEVLKVKLSGLNDAVSMLTSLARGENLTLSESPHIALFIATPPAIKFVDGGIVLTFVDATLIKLGKDLLIKSIEIKDNQIRIKSTWLFGIRTDVLIELV